jgi:predicted nucleic acid-binding protein
LKKIGKEQDFRVLVDTSSFVQYFRHGRGELLPVLALNDSILLSRIVRLELLKGVSKRDRRKLIDFLDGLKQLEDLPDPNFCEENLLKLHSRGLNLGIPDLFILCDALRTESLLYSLDNMLNASARFLGVKTLSPSSLKTWSFAAV